MRYVHTMEYYSAAEGKEVLIRATLWIALEIIILSKRSQSHKTTLCMIPIKLNARIGKFTDGKQISGCLGLGEWGDGRWRGRKRRLTATRCRVSFRGTKML